MKSGILVLGLLVLAGCSAPNTGPAVKSFGETVAAATKSAKPQLDKAVAAQTRAAVAQAARRGDDIYFFPDECSDIAASLDLSDVDDTDGPTIDPCVLSPKVTLASERGTAKFAQEGLQVLEDYAATLAAIAGASVAEDADTNFRALNTSLFQFAATVNAAPRNAPLNADQIGAVGNLLGRVADARRRAILERLVNAAHPEIRTIVYELIAHFQIKGDDDMLGAFDRLDEAFVKMSDAQGTPAYLRAVRAYEQEFERFDKTRSKAQSVKLLAIWRQHQLLREQVKSKPDLDEIRALAKQIKALKA